MNVQNIANLLNSESGKDLRDYIEQEIEKLNTLDAIEVTFNPISLAVELRAAKKAHHRLKEMFKFLSDVSGAAPKVKDPRDLYY
jgi:hypothetical protein